MQFNRVLHDDVLIVTTHSVNIPHVPVDERMVINDLGNPYDHVTHVTLRIGFSDHQDVPASRWP